MTNKNKLIDKIKEAFDDRPSYEYCYHSSNVSINYINYSELINKLENRIIYLEDKLQVLEDRLNKL